MNVYEKLMTVQSQLKAPKGQFNSFGKYKYRNCEDILEALKPLLAEVKAIVTLTDIVEHIGERFYIKATATFIDIENGEKVEVSALAREDEIQKGMSSSQVTGSVSSYARKYSLNGLFCIDDTKDADSDKPPTKDTDNTHSDDITTGSNKPTEALKDEGNTETTITTQMLVEMAKSKGYDEAYLCKKYNTKETKFIKKEVKKEAYEKLKTLPDKI